MYPNYVDPASFLRPLYGPDHRPNHALHILGLVAAPGPEDTLSSFHLAHPGVVEAGREDGKPGARVGT